MHIQTLIDRLESIHYRDPSPFFFCLLYINIIDVSLNLSLAQDWHLM